MCQSVICDQSFKWVLHPYCSLVPFIHHENTPGKLAGPRKTRDIRNEQSLVHPTESTTPPSDLQIHKNMYVVLSHQLWAFSTFVAQAGIVQEQTALYWGSPAALTTWTGALLRPWHYPSPTRKSLIPFFFPHSQELLLYSGIGLPCFLEVLASENESWLV